MSADNGIYILATRGEDGSPELRVAHLQAIDNIHWDSAVARYRKDYLNPGWTHEFFGNCTVFTSWSDAVHEAGKQLTEQLHDFGYVEYGIVVLDHATQPFPQASSLR